MHASRRGVFGLTFAIWQICAATAGEMREKSSTSTCLTVLPAESLSIVWSIPSSTPCGCGLISCASRGSSLGHARELRALALGVHVRERQVRVRDDGLLQVLLHARPPAAVGRDELDLDARAVLAWSRGHGPASPRRSESTVLSPTTSGWLRLVSMRSWIWNAGRPLPVLLVMSTGLPVVSWP